MTSSSLNAAKSALTCAAVLLTAAPAHAAGPIEQFCLAANEPATLCTCSQGVADQTLSLEDQQLGVQLIADPSAFMTLAGQGILTEAFLERWTRFAEVNEQQCL